MYICENKNFLVQFLENKKTYFVMYFDDDGVFINAIEFEGIKEKPETSPAASMVEVVHGEWKEMMYFDEHYGRSYECSNCGKKTIGTSNYCPNCGAEMKKEN